MGKTRRRFIRLGLAVLSGIVVFVLVRAIVLALDRAGYPLVTWLATLIGGFLDAQVLAWLVPGVLGLAGIVGFVLWESFSETREPPTIERSKYPPTLLELFKTDFPETLKLSREVTGKTTDGQETTYLQQAYFDFATNTEFAGFYVPRSPIALTMMNWLATGYREQYDSLKGGIQVASRSLSDLASVPGETLTFTGRVYLYHEDDLTLRQIADLTDLYKENGLHLILRGTSYATQSWLQKKLAETR